MDMSIRDRRVIKHLHKQSSSPSEPGSVVENLSGHAVHSVSHLSGEYSPIGHSSHSKATFINSPAVQLPEGVNC